MLIEQAKTMFKGKFLYLLAATQNCKALTLSLSMFAAVKLNSESTVELGSKSKAESLIR